MDEAADKQEQEKGTTSTPPTAPTAPTPPPAHPPSHDDQPEATATSDPPNAAASADMPASQSATNDDENEYEREDVQKKTFAKWINSQLVKGQHAPVTDLFYDLRDGTRLLALLEVLTNKSYKREKGRMRVHHLNNVSRALNILEEHSVKLVNISNEHIVDGSAKITLGLVWAIILHWQVQGILKDVMSDLQQTNLEKTLLAWCRQATKGYPGVDVRNFTTSWTDGLAFNALIHNHSPQLFDWSVLARKHPYARLENAFRLANENFNIERLLDPEDVNSQVPDKKSIMMYVMCLFQAIPHGTFTMDSLDVSIQSDSSLTMEASSDVGAVNVKKSRPLSNVSIGLGGYQRTLEEVLTWLLGAEDRLAAMPPIAETTDNVKDQFHDLEELMLELTSKQGGIGDVLGEGSRLMREGVMDEEEEEEVRVQMKLLNTRWEELRVKAMDRQSRLHEKLMSLQQKQLESLKRWLTETEDRIANMSQLGPTLEAVREQVKAHQLLQKDLENEQANINSLSNMVVVVDETNSDTVYSTLEDELNALGERWAHICKWAESRWSTLQTLSVHWEHFSGEMEKMRQWMDEKETLLRQMESNPSLEQEHMLQQASMLQVLQAEMDIQHKRLEHVQSESAKILSHLPQESSAQETMPSDMETLQDRLDCLVSIVEAQTQRLAASGIDITKVVAPTDGSSDVVSSSTTTISNEGGTVVTKIITTKVVTTEIVEGSVKRQKLEGGSQEDFTVALHQLGGWMDNIEAQLKPKAMEELSVEQLNQVVQQLESEMEKQKEEYYKVISLGESAISETSTIGESSQESEQQVAGVSSRWEALTEMLVQIRTRVTYLTEKKKISIELSDMDVAYQGFLRWCEDVRTVSENEPNAVALQMEQCQNKVAAMQDYEKQISALKASSESLDTRWSQETHILLEQIELFVVKWNALLQRLVEWNETLKEQIERTSSAPEVTVKSKQSPPESLLKAMEASRNWLESLEVALAAEYSVTTLPQMQEQHAKFKDLSQKVEMEQGNMAHINEACNVLLKEGHVDISEDISKLNNQWKTTTEALNSRITALEKVIEKQKQYNDEVSGLQSWLAEVDVFLKAEDAALGDVETLEAQLEQSNALQDDIVTLQTNVTNITLTGKQLMDDSNVELKAVIQTQLEDLTKRWEVVTHMAQAQNKSLKEALARSQKVHDDIEKLNSWLEVTEQKIPTNSVIETSEDLTTMIQTFDQLREDINNHSADFRALNDTGNEMLQQDSSATHDDLARQFTQLNGRWTEVVSQVDSKHKVLTTAVQHYEDFKKLCQEETEWLDQLEEKLKKSSKTAADAEEISEALDELEIFLHSHDESRLEKIRHLAEELVRENCMAVAVQTSTHTLTSRFNSLNVKASEQKSGLEGGVQEAQAWEREYVSVLDYLAQSDLLLSQAIADPQLEVAHAQVQSELLMQQDILKKMQTQVEVYREQGKTEAAMRLEDQVTHLKKKCEEIEVKLHLCQKPSDFDDRLNQMQVQLEDISQNVLVVQRTSGAPEGIQDQLDQCMALYQRLSEVKGEVESVIATGRKIVKEGQSAEPDKLTLQLDQLKALYNQLGGAVTEQRSVLERAHRQCRKIYKDTSQLEEWLTTTECELDQREATIPTKHVQGELDFAQSEQIAKEAEMENFIVGLGEIKGWLQSTEVQLARINSLEPQEQARMIQAISSEVQDYRGQIENIRDTAVDLINHGALFQARIQPELVNINQRWENIFKAVQVTSACEVDNSSLASVAMSSTGQASATTTTTTTTISYITAPDSVITYQYSSLSEKNPQRVAQTSTATDSVSTITHVASGMSASMLDFFSRHNVLIIDSDLKGEGTALEGVTMPPEVRSIEVQVDKSEETGAEEFEDTREIPSSFSCPNSEVLSDTSIVGETAENFSIYSKTTGCNTSAETLDFNVVIAERDASEACHQVAQTSENDVTMERRISTASLENEVVPFEIAMELVTEELPLKPEVSGSAIEVSSEAADEAMVATTTSVFCRGAEIVTMNGKQESTFDEDRGHIESTLSPGAAASATEKSAMPETRTQVIAASDMESGSVIEIIYKVEEPKRRKQYAVSPLKDDDMIQLVGAVGKTAVDESSIVPMETTISKDYEYALQERELEMEEMSNVRSCAERKMSLASQNFVISPQEAVLVMGTPTTTSESFLWSQALPSAEEESMGCAVSAEVELISEDLTKNNIDRKISVASVEMELAPEEVASDFEMQLHPAGTFAVERETSAVVQDNLADTKVITSEVIQLGGSCTMIKVSSELSENINVAISTKSENADVNGEGAQAACDISEEVSSSIPEAALTDVPVASLSQVVECVSQEAEEPLVTDSSSKVTEVSGSVQGLPLTDKEKAIDVLQFSELPRSGGFVSTSVEEVTDISRKISVASMEIDIMPEEVAGVVEVSDQPNSSFAFERQTSITAQESFTDNVVIASEIVKLMKSESRVAGSCSVVTEQEVHQIPSLPVVVNPDSVSSMEIVESKDERLSQNVAEPIMKESEVTVEDVPKIEKEKVGMAVLQPSSLVTGDITEVVERSTRNLVDGMSVSLSANNETKEMSRKISTASIEVLYTEELLGEQRDKFNERFAYKSEVSSADDNCYNSNVVITSVKSVSGTQAPVTQKTGPVPKQHLFADVEVVSEVSEESIPLGGEAALIDPSNLSEYGGESLLEDGSNFADTSVDEINFIRGVKSAMPTGYTFRTDVMEDDSMSEALSYYDIQTSVDVKDRYGVAVTVAGTIGIGEILDDNAGGKETRPDEDWHDDIVIEPSFISKTSSVDSLVDSDVRKRQKITSGNRVGNSGSPVASKNTFLTEFTISGKENVCTSEFLRTPDEFQFGPVSSTADEREQHTQKEVLCEGSVPISEENETGTEKPFESVIHSRKIDIPIDKLSESPQVNVVEGQKNKVIVAKEKVQSTEVSIEKTSKLEYLPYRPRQHEYGQIVKKEENSVDISKVQLADSVVTQDRVVKVHYVPHSPAQSVKDNLSEADPDSGLIVPVSQVTSTTKVDVRTKEEIMTSDKDSITKQTVNTNSSEKLEANLTKDLVKEAVDEGVTGVAPGAFSSDTAPLKDDTVSCVEEKFEVDDKTADDYCDTGNDNIVEVDSQYDTSTISGSQIWKDDHSFPYSADKKLSLIREEQANETEVSTTEQYVPHHSPADVSEIELTAKVQAEASATTSVGKQSTELGECKERKDNIAKIEYVPHVSLTDDKEHPLEVKVTSESTTTHLIKAKLPNIPIAVKGTDVQTTKQPPELVKSSKEVKKDVDKSIHYVPYSSDDTANADSVKAVDMMKVTRTSEISYVPHVPLSSPVQSMEEKVVYKNDNFDTMKETDITFDEKESSSSIILSKQKMESASKAQQGMQIHYVPHAPSDTRLEPQAASSTDRTSSSVPVKTEISDAEVIRKMVLESKLKPRRGTHGLVSEDQSKKVTSITEAQVHVSQVKTITESKQIDQKKAQTVEIHYVPCAPGDVPKDGAPTGARPKEIQYVPHSPADLEKIQSEVSQKNVTDPSVLLSPLSSAKLDTPVTCSAVISDDVKQQDAVQAGRSSFETSVTTKRHITESSQLQVKTSIYSSSASEMTQLDDDEVDSYLREVTAMSDKITDLKTKLLTVPSYQEAQEMSDALEQEVASLEPDVATVISRGDTLTLTTHMVNVPRANNIRTAVKDLRSQWSALKTDTENMKVETEQVARDISNISTKGDEIINWANDASKKLHLVNNDESQLEALEQEMVNKKKELDKLNESRALLRKYRYTRAEPMLNLVNSRWTDVTTQFRQYRKVSLEKKTIVDPSKVEIEPDTAIVPDFVASVNRLREAISAISRQVNANKLAGNHYDNLKTQEEELKVIKEGLETLKPRVDGLETERNVAVKNATPTQTEQVRRVMDKLREEWAQVNRGHTERHTRWLQCSETWRTLQKTIDDFGVWLNTIEERVNVTASQPLPEAKITQKELEKQVTLKHRPSQTLQSSCKEVVEGMNHDDGKRLQEHVDTLMKRWRALLLDLAARREKIASEEGGKEGTSSDYEILVTWVDQAQALMEAPVNVTDEASLSAHSTMVQNHVLEMNVKQNSLKRLKDSKPKGISPQQMTSLETNMNKVVKTLPEYKNMVETKLGVIKTLVKDVEDLYKWTEEMRVKVALRNLTDEDLKCAKLTLREKETLYENLDSTYWVLAQDTESKGLTVAVTLKNRMNTIESRLKALQGQLYDTATLTSASPTSSSATSPTFSSKGTEKVDLEKVVQGTPPQEGGSKVEDRKVEKVESTLTMAAAGSTVTPSVTTVIQNVMKFEESVLSTESELRPPSPLVSPPKYGPDSSPVLILASLDKSILQIRDWLTLMEQMTRQQTVEVGDADSIRQLTEKQKSVLRELEGKKPQLDELVASADSLKDDASRTQLHQKVSKLREHWDETNSVVLARKTQLDAMLVDTHKFDSKRSELETWLARMEARLERMAPVAHTADVLDQQIREQKGFHAEIHQYKHQVELFNQMTQRLIAIYQHDDTRRLKKITESINMRYSTLNSSIISRGKALHSAMNSLHNFDKSLDKFASWLSEVESSTDMLEAETDKLGPTRRDPQARATAIRLKDLQSEIESHKDVLASLNATGQKLLGTLENQDEAVMLQRRLEEMNQRWNTLKHKSIAIRNRLEGNAENWNSLLLSLRELIEWVIRKDTELTALGPLVGDLGSLSKFGEDLSSFRRVIDEKQPVIESNLKSGRQLIASEPPLSDTSDSEAGRELDGDARYRGDDNARDLTRSVRREVAKLSEKWAALRERAGAAAAQADLAYKKLGVLQKTVEDVSGRLEEAEKTVEGWGPLSQDPNLADQHAHNVRKFREGLAELQRGVDDVNDQAARFSAHNVPLTPANSAKLHDLNNRWKSLETTVNDRWRQVAGRSREVTPLTPAQLASSVSPPWERATTSNKVPYYINHDQENTHWDHPVMMDLLDSLTEFNHIKFSAYRTAMKLRMLQKKLALDCAKMQMATDIFDEHGLRGQNDRLIDVGDMVVVLSALYANISADHPEVDTTLAMDLCLNWLLNVYDSQRTGQMRVLSFKIGLVCLCSGHLEEKYRYMFRLIADPNRLVDQRKLGLLLHDCVQVPRQLGEVAAFGGSNIEPSVRSCFTKAGKDRDTIEALHFLAWVQQEPQSLVWLAVLHRVAASETIQHQVKCNICKAYPILGLRYRCLKCLSFDMCQRCFFDGRSGKSHKITHPMHEYCTATTAGEDVKDFTKALKNKFKSKRSLQKHTKKGYLPVQSVLEGDPLESPSPSPQHNVTSQDMHSRLELYASRLAEVELRTNSNSTPDSEDEHGLIAQYCQSLSSSDAPLPVPRSPLQIMAAVDAEQKDELEQMIRALEEENSVLQAEYDRLKSQQPVGSPPDDGLSGQRSEADMLAEAKLLRQHKGRLEARMGILEEHNRQLEAQLHRLRQLLGEPGGVSSPNKSGTLQTKSVTASQLAMDSPAKVNGHSTQAGASSTYEGLEQMSEYVRPPPPPMGNVAHVGNLFSRAGDLGKAVGTLVATMTHEEASDLPSDEEDSRASDTEEEKAV